MKAALAVLRARSLWRLALIGAGLWLASPLWLQALRGQNVYTDLTQPAQIRTFNAVSDALICQCGCHFVLSSCPHVECPWGIPVRRFIEDRIRAGLSAEQIVDAMDHGFGAGIRSNVEVQSMIAAGRNDLAEELVRGYGPRIRAHASWTPLLGLVVAALGAAALLIAFWHSRNRRRLNSTSGGSDGRKQRALQGSDKSAVSEIDRQLDDLER
ncbi:MAG: hypothetical protein K1X75_02265 [Leptospirales bacterium]|nr:hypothetical protein [Leptospirales bacterium]